MGFPGGTVVKNLPVNTGGDSRDMGSIPGSRSSPGGGNGNLLQYSCTDNTMDREAWRATVHGVTKSDTMEQLTTARLAPLAPRLPSALVTNPLD